MAGPHQRARQPRTANRGPGLRPGALEQRLDVHGHAVGGQALADLAHALHAQALLAVEEHAERGVVMLDEVGQHVHVAGLVHRRDLDARHDPHAVPAPRRVTSSIDCVVS